MCRVVVKHYFKTILTFRGPCIVIYYKTNKMHQFLKFIFGIELYIAVSITCMTYLLLCIQHQTPDDGQKICPKHVEFHSKNKFEKFVHLVGFIIRIFKTIVRALCTSPSTHSLSEFTQVTVGQASTHSK